MLTHHVPPPLTHRYDLAWVLRYDLAFLEPFVLSQLERAQLWLPQQCCSWQPDPTNPVVPEGVRTALQRAERACLGGAAPQLVDLCRASHFLRAGGKSASSLVREAERNMFVNDWFFLAPSGTADTWAALYHNFDLYAAALDELGIPLRWHHFLWAAHVYVAPSSTPPRPLCHAPTARAAGTTRCG